MVATRWPEKRSPAASKSEASSGLFASPAIGTSSMPTAAMAANENLTLQAALLPGGDEAE